MIKAIDACKDQHFRDGVSAGTENGKPNIAQRRADAFVALADDWRSAKRKTPSNSDAYQVVRHFPVGTSEEPLWLEEEDVIAVAAAKRIYCDARVVSDLKPLTVPSCHPQHPRSVGEG